MVVIPAKAGIQSGAMGMTNRQEVT
jgi:hypothetical protein